MGWSLSIDLGTTNTAAAVRYGDAAPTTLRLTLEGALPSAVFLSAASVYVGEAAWEHADEDPAAFYPSPKRLLMQTPVEQTQPLEPVFAALYREVHLRACAECGPEAPDTVVLTHPAALADRAKNLLTRAAVAAGVSEDSIVLVPEQVAAAAHYYRDADVPQRLLVVDIGGGTCDTGVIRFDSSGTPRVVASDGDNGLGGRTFDSRLAHALAAKLDGGVPDMETLQLLDTPELHRRISQVREELSARDSCDIDLGEELGTVAVSRREFEDAVSGDLDRILTLGRRSLGAGTADAADALTRICLTGGTALTPAVQDVVSRLGTVRPLEDPFSAVSLGALLTSEAAEAAETAGRARSAEVATAPDERTPQRRTRWRRIAVPAVAAVAVLALVGGLFLVNRGDDTDGVGGVDGAGDQAAPQDPAAAEDRFDPSPVVPVTLADDSPLLDGDVLDCSGVMDVAATAAGEELEQRTTPHATGTRGKTHCDLGTELFSAVGLETFRPHQFTTFTSQRRNDEGASLEAVPSLPGWYELSSEWLGWKYVFLYVEDIGWLSVSVKDEDAAQTDVAVHIAEALDPVLKIQDR